MRETPLPRDPPSMRTAGAPRNGGLYTIFVRTGVTDGGGGACVDGSTPLVFSVETEGGIWLVGPAEYKKYGTMMPSVAIQNQRRAVLYFMKRLLLCHGFA